MLKPGVIFVVCLLVIACFPVVLYWALGSILICGVVSFLILPFIAMIWLIVKLVNGVFGSNQKIRKD
ncbi:MAG: hypothetical protein LBD57_04305 [Endomicrobium sp.]|jgi:hypothetical protein|uniref:hypothetical protein n=1 Tax=Candidatus Endomicrobiellum cubanum TaxID=3242325 RepID=UPI00283767A5|nr:hypothetical protein [Endomicrobium sp.]